jgi:hypothetical protein
MTLSALELDLIGRLQTLLSTEAPPPSVLAGSPDPTTPPTGPTLLLQIDTLEPRIPPEETPDQRRQPVAASLLLEVPTPPANGNAGGHAATNTQLSLPPYDRTAFPRLVEVLTPEGRLLPIPDVCSLDSTGQTLCLRILPPAAKLLLRFEGPSRAGYRDSTSARLGLQLAACTIGAEAAETLLLQALAEVLRRFDGLDVLPLSPSSLENATTQAGFLLRLRHPLPVLGPLRREAFPATPPASPTHCCQLRLWLEGQLEWSLVQPPGPEAARITGVTTRMGRFSPDA